MSAFTVRGRLISLITVITLTYGAFRLLSAACPPGWLNWRDYCYILSSEKMNWFQQASKLCDRPGSSLIVPDSQEEHDFIWREMRKWVEDSSAAKQDKFELWIGCKDPENKMDELVCLGKKGNPAYTNWSDGEPNSPTETCVRMAEKFHGQWGDALCENLKLVVCKMHVYHARRVYCLPSDADGRFTPQCLLDHHIKNLTTTGVTGCGQACWAEPRCHSFNLWQQADNVKKICQLNDATHLEADVTDFKKVDNCSFFEL